MTNKTKNKRPSARARGADTRSVGTVAAPRLRVIEGGVKAPISRNSAVSENTGLDTLRRMNPAWARLALADVLALDWVIPGLGGARDDAR